MNPGQSMLPGVLQVVATACSALIDPGGFGVSGDGNAARIALLINGNAKSIRCISA